MRFRGIGRIQNFSKRLRGIIAPGPTILLYHRVAELTADPQLLAVSPAHFDGHLSVLKKHYNIMPLDDLVTAVINGIVPKKAVAITFDDGYADNFQHAWPLLKKHSIPATIYLTTGYISSNREFFCDELERLLLCQKKLPQTIRLIISGRQYEWFLRPKSNSTLDIHNNSWSIENLDNPTPAHRAYREIHQLVRILPYEMQRQILDQIRKAVGDDGSARPSHLAMSWGQIKKIADDRLVNIGAHTVNHAYLSSLSINAQQSEIIGSVKAIESHINKKVTSFAYPYGTRDAYDGNTLSVMRQIGFMNSVSNYRARISPSVDPYQLPRLIIRDYPRDTFRRYLRRNVL